MIVADIRDKVVTAYTPRLITLQLPSIWGRPCVPNRRAAAQGIDRERNRLLSPYCTSEVLW